jgi:NhaA family Na+:H+ antiporter
MLAAAALFLLVASPADRGAWGIPVSTDVAFALAVLAAAGRGLPVELRVFLLTVAVVNDLGAIVVIAAFYGGDLHPAYAAGLLAAVAGIAAMQRAGGRAWSFVAPPVYIALPVMAWYCCLRLGVHPTVAGALVGLALPSGDGGRPGPGDRALGMLRPLSAGVCVPLFAFTALGVSVDAATLGNAVHDRLLLGIVLGLAVGQPAGVLAGTWVATRAGGRLSAELGWRDVAIVGRLAGIGLTVALLVAGVAFADQPERLAVAKVSVLVAIAASTVMASAAARLQVRRISRRHAVAAAP